MKLYKQIPVETEAAASIMVSKVRAALNARFRGGNAPNMILTDRGNGLYDSGRGAITVAYRAALKQHKLKAFMGDNAAIPPGALQEMMLHETAMARVRERLKRTVPTLAWEEIVEQYFSRLKAVAAYVNANYDVEGACKEFPQRLRTIAGRQKC